MECFETYGGHLHKCQGSGKSNTCISDGLHRNDVTSSLKLFAQWIIKISESESEDKKRKVLLHLMPLLETANPSEQLLSKSAIPSPYRK